MSDEYCLNMYQGTRPLYNDAAPVPLPELEWPSKIYLATTGAGVFYTDNFVSPLVQPTWTAVNTGLPTTGCAEFRTDPFNEIYRQYVRLSANNTIYRREGGGNWTAILSPAQVIALFGGGPGTIGAFCTDSTIDGRLWASVESIGCYTAIKSDDYGTTWNTVAGSVCPYLRGLGPAIRAQGDYVYFTACTGQIFYGPRIITSINGGASFAIYSTMSLVLATGICFNILTPSKIWIPNGAFTHPDLAKMLSDGTNTIVKADIIASYVASDYMWFDPADPDHHRLFYNGTMYITTDDWGTTSNLAGITSSPIIFAHWASDNPDKMIVGNLSLGAQNHVIACMIGEADTTPDGIAGTNCGTPPYTDSIPKTCGGICQGSIFPIKEPGYVYI